MASTRTPRQFRTAVQASFKAAIDAMASPPPVVYDNKGLKTTGGEYVHLNVAHSGGTIAALGNEKYRRTGIIVVNIFVPEAVGQQRSDEIGEAVLGWLETFNVAGVRIRDPGYNDVGSFGGYWQSNASASFEYDAIRS